MMINILYVILLVQHVALQHLGCWPDLDWATIHYHNTLALQYLTESSALVPTVNLITCFCACVGVCCGKLSYYWANVHICLIGSFRSVLIVFFSILCFNGGLTLVQRRRRWTTVKPTLIQRLVSAGLSRG